MDELVKCLKYGNRIGLDKVVFANLILTDINFVQLRAAGGQIDLCSPGTYSLRTDEHGMPVKRIKVRDNLVFNDLYIGYAGTNGYLVEYIILL